MSFLKWAIGLGIVGSVLSKRNKTQVYKAVTPKRTDYPFSFPDGLDQEDFNSIVENIGNRISRISRITTDGPKVYGTVLSQSGISEWDFEIDFNDHGVFTGTYWFWSENDESAIPERVGDLISRDVNTFVRVYSEPSESSESDSSDSYDSYSLQDILDSFR